MAKPRRQENGAPTSTPETPLPSSSFPSSTSSTDSSTETSLSNSILSSESPSFTTSSITIASTSDLSQLTSISMSTTFVTISQAVIITAATPSMTTATTTIYASRPPNSTSNSPKPPLGESLPPPTGVDTGRILLWVACITGGVAFLISIGVLVWCLFWGRRRKERDTHESDGEPPRSPPQLSISGPLLPMDASNLVVPGPPPAPPVTTTQPSAPLPPPPKVPARSRSFTRRPSVPPATVTTANPPHPYHRPPPPVPRVFPKSPPQQIPTQWATVPKLLDANPKLNPAALYNPETPPYTPSHYSQAFYGGGPQYRQQLDTHNPDSRLEASSLNSGWGSSGVWTDVGFLTGVSENNRNIGRNAGTRASSTVLPI